MQDYPNGNFFAPESKEQPFRRWTSCNSGILVKRQRIEFSPCNASSLPLHFVWHGFLVNSFSESFFTKIASPNLRCTYTSAVNFRPTAWLITEFAAVNTTKYDFLRWESNREGFGVNNVAYNAYVIFPLISVARSESRSFSNFVQKNVPKRLDTVLCDPIGACVESHASRQLFGGNNRYEILWH